MNNEIRSIKQEIFADTIKKYKRSIMRSSIRFGKTKVGLMTIGQNESVLIAYPRLQIKNSWTGDIAKFGVNTNDISYSTFASLHKINRKFDYVIVDEFHKLSPKQTESLFKLVDKKLLMITGTLKFRKKKYWINRGIPIVVEYDLEDAINDKLVKDYRIILHYVDLEKEERQSYDKLSSQIDWAEEKKELALISNNKEDVKKYDLISKKYIGQRTNLLYNTEASKKKAKELIDSLKEEKVLIFALRTSVADELAEKSFHSKSKNVDVLDEFKISENGHLSTVNVINEGITISHLNHIVCHTITSNTEDFQQKLGRGLQLGEVNDKVCNVHVVVIQNTQSEKWIEEACKSLNQEKIYYSANRKLIPKIEIIKALNRDKEIYLYEGSFCYKVGPNLYKFLNDKVDREYSLPERKLKVI